MYHFGKPLRETLGDQNVSKHSKSNEPRSPFRERWVVDKENLPFSTLMPSKGPNVCQLQQHLFGY